MNFAEFVSEKGAKNLALVCDVAEPTAYSWVSRNVIPRKHWDSIMAKYRIAYRTLLQMERASNSERV